ncbi:MAG: hypothetical protein ACFBSE_18590 [Prochloraceae cyanobacterium]
MIEKIRNNKNYGQSKINEINEEVAERGFELQKVDGLSNIPIDPTTIRNTNLVLNWGEAQNAVGGNNSQRLALEKHYQSLSQQGKTDNDMSKEYLDRRSRRMFIAATSRKPTDTPTYKKWLEIFRNSIILQFQPDVIKEKPASDNNNLSTQSLTQETSNNDRDNDTTIAPTTLQTTPVDPNGKEPGIVLDPVVDFAVTGTTITYGFHKGETLLPNQAYSYQWYVHNDKDAISQQRQQNPLNRLNPFLKEVVTGPKTVNFTVPWGIVGKHTVICHVYTQGKITNTYKYIQTVKDPQENADEQFKNNNPQQALQPDVYLAQLEVLRQFSDPEKDADKIEKLDKAIENTKDKLGITDGDLKGNSYPLKTILVPQAYPDRTVPLQLYLRPAGKDERWEIVDLTNPSPDAARTYIGDTPNSGLLPAARRREAIRSAWSKFLENNTNPAGQIVTQLPPDLVNNAGFSGEQTWSDYSNGISTLQKIREWFSAIGLGTGLGAIVVGVTNPGAGVVVGWLLLTSSVAAGAAGSLSIADRLQHGNFQWNGQTLLDLTDIVSGLAVGTQASIALRGKAAEITQLSSAILIAETADTGSDLTAGVILSAIHYKRIQEIRADSNLSEAQKKVLIEEELRKAAVTGGLILLGMTQSGGGKKGKKQNSQTIRITESGYTTVKKGARDSIEISQQELNELRKFGLTTDEIRQLESGSITKADREALIAKHDAAFQDLIETFATRGRNGNIVDVEKVKLLVQRLQGKTLRKINEATGNEGLQLVLDVIALEKKGKVFEFDDWLKFLSQGNKSNEQIYNIVVELKETKRIAKDLKEGEIIRIGGDERKTIDRDGNEQSSFDLTVENQRTKKVERNIEVTTVRDPIQDYTDLTQGITHAIEKRASGVKRGTVEATIEIPSILDQRGIGGGRRWYYDPNNGNFVIVERDGTIRTAPQNIFQRIADNLPEIETGYQREVRDGDRIIRRSASEINPNINIIDRVNIIDSNGLLIATIVKENGVWIVKR